MGESNFVFITNLCRQSFSEDVARVFPIFLVGVLPKVGSRLLLLCMMKLAVRSCSYRNGNKFNKKLISLKINNDSKNNISGFRIRHSNKLSFLYVAVH